jgi:hypothetical protein
MQPGSFCPMDFRVHNPKKKVFSTLCLKKQSIPACGNQQDNEDAGQKHVRCFISRAAVLCADLEVHVPMMPKCQKHQMCHECDTHGQLHCTCMNTIYTIIPPCKRRTHCMSGVSSTLACGMSAGRGGVCTWSYALHMICILAPTSSLHETDCH